MAAISQTTFSIVLNENVGILIRISLKFVLFLKVKLTIFSFCSDNGLVDQVRSQYLNQWWLFYWQIYASLDFNDLRINIGLRYIESMVFMAQIYWRAYTGWIL